MNDTKHIKALISGAFVKLSDFWVGQWLIDFFAHGPQESVGKYLFFCPEAEKKLEVALNWWVGLETGHKTFFSRLMTLSQLYLNLANSPQLITSAGAERAFLQSVSWGWLSYTANVAALTGSRNATHPARRDQLQTIVLDTKR